MKRTLFGLLMLIAQMAVADSTPTYYSFHPMSTMYLGSGFTPPSPISAKPSCVTGNITDVDGEGAGSGEFSTSVVNSTNNVRDAMRIDAKVDASYLAFKGGATFNFDQSMTFDENSVSVLMYAANTFSRKVIMSPALTTSAKALLDAGKTQQFIQQCGSQLVNMEQRGVMISVILTIHNISETAKKLIKTSVSASGGYGPLSGSASTAFQSELSKASSENRLQSNILYIGGGGTTAMEQMVRSTLAGSPTMDGISAGISNYIKTMTKDNAAPLGYFVTDMPGLVAAVNSPWTDLKQSRLQTIVSTYRKYKNAADQISAIAAGTDARATVLQKQQISALTNWLPTIEAYLSTIATVHEKCLADVTPTSDQCALPPESAFQLSMMPYPNKPPEAVVRVIAGEDKWSGTLLSKADSEAILGSLVKDTENDLQNGLSPKTQLLARTKSTIPNTRAAWKILLISSPYLDSMRVYIEPTGDFRKRYTDQSPKHLTTEPIGRIDLPNYSALQNGKPEYIFNDVFFDTITNPVYLEKDPNDIMGIQPLVSSVYFQMQTFVMGASADTNAATGTADYVVEVRDVLGNTVKFKPYSFAWTYNKDKHNGKITIHNLGEENSDTLMFKVYTKADCLKDNPQLGFLCNNLPD